MLIMSMAPIGVPIVYADLEGDLLRMGGQTPLNLLTDAGLKTVGDIQKSLGNDGFGCGLITLFTNCVAAMVYYIGPGLASNVAYIGAYFFSIVIQLSLNSTAYALDFLSKGWETVRDIANMTFIFILIYIAIMVMLEAETAGTIKTLAVVVMIALLVNFSFFFTRVAIDTGNILALQFYNAIPAGLDSNNQPVTLNGVKDLSASIMGAVQLQKLYGQDAFEKAKQSCGGTSNGSMCGLIVSSLIYLSVAAMFWMLFFVFVQVGIKFLLRIVGLWFLLIASPLAFVARTMKQTEHFFHQWLRYLIEFSLYPAIFLFMFLILTKFTKDILTVNGQGGSLMQATFNSSGDGGVAGATGIAAAIAAVAIRMGFVIALMYVALKVSDWVVKEGSGIASTVTGRIGGGVLGTAKLAGRYGPGWAAGAAYRNTLGGNFFGYGAAGLSKKVARSTWLNNSGFGGVVGYRLNKNVLKPMTETSLGTVASSYKARKEFLDTRKKEMGNNIKDIQNNKNVQDYAKLEALVGPLSQAQMDNKAALQDEIQKFTKRHLEEIKPAVLEQAASALTESQFKTVQGSEKFSEADIDKIAQAWHEKASDAPLKKADKQIKLLRELNETLKSGAHPVTMAKVDREIGTKSAPLNAVIDSASIKEMQAGIENHISIMRATPKTVEREQNISNLNKALKAVEKLAEETAKIPAHAGGVADPKKFNTAAVV